MIAGGNININELFIGETNISEVYAGDTKIFPASIPPQPIYRTHRIIYPWNPEYDDYIKEGYHNCIVGMSGLYAHCVRDEISIISGVSAYTHEIGFTDNGDGTIDLPNDALIFKRAPHADARYCVFWNSSSKRLMKQHLPNGPDVLAIASGSPAYIGEEAYFNVETHPELVHTDTTGNIALGDCFDISFDMTPVAFINDKDYKYEIYFIEPL